MSFKFLALYDIEKRKCLNQPVDESNVRHVTAQQNDDRTYYNFDF